jgi:hypothetical protein
MRSFKHPLTGAAAAVALWLIPSPTHAAQMGTSVWLDQAQPDAIVELAQRHFHPRPGVRPHPGYRPGPRPRPGYRPGYRPGGWARPGRYYWPRGGAIAAGAALGFVGAATAAAWAGAAPAPGMCWYYTDSSRRRGFWDYCP